MAVLVIVGMPVLQATLQNYRFRSATDWVMGDIRQTRSLAVPQGKFLSYHGTSTGTYRIERSTTGTAWPADTDTPASNADVITPLQNIPQIYFGVNLGRPVDAGSTTLTRIILNSLGNSVAPGGSVTNPISITITSPSGTTQVLQVSQLGSVKKL
jgi:Tfp pilus assembly protein FimT